MVYLATRATPAEAAGFELGDVIVGPPGAPFTEPNQIREWTMLSKIDEVRRAFLAYGVSGTPTIVLVDGQGNVRSYSTGYSSAKGLGIDGWNWRDRPAQRP